MPLYEFSCLTCGDFEIWRRIAESSDPVYCNECNALSKRVYSAPNVNLSSGRLASLSRSVSDEPRVIKRETVESQPKINRPKGRPWMISHPPDRL